MRRRGMLSPVPVALRQRQASSHAAAAEMADWYASGDGSTVNTYK